MEYDTLTNQLLHSKSDLFALYDRIVALCHKRGIRIIKDTIEKKNVVGFQCLNTLVIDERLLMLHEIIPVLSHELGHWTDQKHISGQTRRFLTACREYGLQYESGFPLVINSENTPAERYAWLFAKRFINFLLNYKKGDGELC